MSSVLAGFVEPGEDIAHAVRRETHEETGVEVGTGRVLAMAPDAAQLLEAITGVDGIAPLVESARTAKPSTVKSIPT